MGLQTNKHTWGTSQCRYQPSFSPYQTGALVREREVSEHNSNTVWIYGDNNIYPLVICHCYRKSYKKNGNLQLIYPATKW